MRKASVKLVNNEVPELLNYIRAAKAYAYNGGADQVFIQSMVADLVYSIYASLLGRYTRDNTNPSYTLSMTASEAAAIMMYYDYYSLPENPYSRVLVHGIMTDIQQQLS